MGKGGVNELVKGRMSATRRASELEGSNEAYQRIFREAPPSGSATVRDLPLDKLTPFFTADIGFKPYPPSKLKAFAEQLNEEGLMSILYLKTLKRNTPTRHFLTPVRRT